MNQSESIQLAKEGKTLMLPKWKGYFDWDYGKLQLRFRNGSYLLCGQELLDKVKGRTDWFYIT